MSDEIKNSFKPLLLITLQTDFTLDDFFQLEKCFDSIY